MRSISEIYSEAVAARNSYLHLTELNSGRTNSKLSLLNLITYVVAVCIYGYECVLDLFQVRIAETLADRINGTPNWYAQIAKKFQYNSILDCGDEIRFNENTLKVEYVTPNTSHRIVAKTSWQMDDQGQAMILKVCKSNGKEGINNGAPYIPLSSKELTAFREFIENVRFVGATIYCQSLPGDIITLMSSESSPIFYDDLYVTEVQALSIIQRAFIDFINTSRYNDMLYYQDFIDVLQKADHISYVSKDVRVMISSYNAVKGRYDEPVELINRMRLKSGHMRLLDENQITTVTPANIYLAPASTISNYRI